MVVHVFMTILIGLKLMKQYSNQAAKGQGVIFKRTLTDDKARRMGLKPALFSNPVYAKMNTIRTIVSNSPTKVPTMKHVIFGGTTPPKNGRKCNHNTSSGFYILYYLRDHMIDLSFECDVTGAPFFSNDDYYREAVKGMDMLFAVHKRINTAKKAKI